MIWLSTDLRIKCFGCHLICDSSDLVVKRFELQFFVRVDETLLGLW